MRRGKFGWRLGGWILIGLTTAAALVPSVGAYVNGGDSHSTFKTFQKQLKAAGWAMGNDFFLPDDCDRTREVKRGVKVVPPDNPGYRDYVNLLVGRALRSLPKKEAARISDEAKREVVRRTREALQNAVLHKKHTVRKGRVGSLEYQVGAFEFESYWETNYSGNRKIHEHRWGLAPFVALRVVGAEELPDQ